MPDEPTPLPTNADSDGLPRPDQHRSVDPAATDDHAAGDQADPPRDRPDEQPDGRVDGRIAEQSDGRPDTRPDEPPDGPVGVSDDDDATDRHDVAGPAGPSNDSESAGRPTISIDALEALLFSTRHPLTAGRLAELLDQPASGPIRKAVAALNEAYQATGRCFRVEQVAGGYQLLTLPEHGDVLKRLHDKETDAKLGKAALETLAIIAYKQPILRASVEAIRGVACGETIRNLMEKHLVRIAGRAEEPGRPILYGTTKRFLEVFGLNQIGDLPKSDTLQPKPAAPPPSPVPPAAS